MRGVRVLASCLVLLGVLAPANGQPSKVEIKGQAQVSAHPHKMEKGQTYRITVKGEGFVPQVHVDDNASVGTTKSLPGNITQLIYTASATRVYQIKVDPMPGIDIGKGPHPYTLTIERATLKPHLTAKDVRHELSEHTRSLERGKYYGITVTGTGFAPEIQIMDGKQMVATSYNGRWFGFGPDAECIINLTFTPSRSAEYRLVVAVGSMVEQRTAPLTFTTRVVELKVELSVSDKLAHQDPIYPARGGPHKVYPLKLDANKHYQIDMTSSFFDAYLFLEDSAGNLLMEDDDSGGAQNARLLFRPTKSGTYRIIATTFNRAGPGLNLGTYSLSVVENPNGSAAFPAPASLNNPMGNSPFGFKK